MATFESFVTLSEWKAALTKEQRLLALLVRTGELNDIDLEFVCDTEEEIALVLSYAKSNVNMSE